MGIMFVHLTVAEDYSMTSAKFHLSRTYLNMGVSAESPTLVGVRDFSLAACVAGRFNVVATALHFLLGR
jgi:hypothetical protein